MKPPIGFRRRKAVIIPSWATTIRVVANAIDGCPPITDGVYAVDDWLEKAGWLQSRLGAGEWDVRVYALDDPEGAREIHPYGAQNPYRKLRALPGHQAKCIAAFDYMRWFWHDFSKATPDSAPA
jgi:hypothetical protein